MLRTLSLAALGFGLAAITPSPAAALAPDLVTAHIPFAFSVRNETLPAGDYEINPVSDIDRDALEIRSTDGRHAAVFLSHEAPAGLRGTTPELIFDRYGNQMFLHSIRLPEETGAALNPSRSEVQAARSVSSSPSAQGVMPKGTN
ncbi:MAG TPA: hypothetical protein VL691_19655 [Vicinamibacteria bacterium]|nr:hypothetical protein [Vicinamibacteria bacterium]